MSWAMVAMAGTSIVSGLINSSAASSAADAQKEASKEAARIQWQMYQRSREDLAPWVKTGEEANKSYWEKVQAGPGEFKTSPGYEWRVGEGEKAIERARSARGGLGSGAFAKDMSNYNQQSASSEYQNFLNQYYQSLTPYSDISNRGQAAAAQQATSALQTGVGMANSAQAAGNAQAAGYINQANAVTGALGSGINNYLAYKSYQPATTPTSTTNFLSNYGSDTTGTIGKYGIDYGNYQIG